jgi:RimJ/RimL family protein N-acetyltransferase
MAIEPARCSPRSTALRLEAFDPRRAELVATWVRSQREAYWLAPKTPPPLDGDRIRQWRVPGHEPLQFIESAGTRLVGYGELNVLNANGRHFWLGHLIVDPDARGQGIGLELTQLLLARAFVCRGAQHVSLVVFPDNQPAIACYRAAGLREQGYEEHVFPPHARQVRLIRMSIQRGAWERARARPSI